MPPKRAKRAPGSAGKNYWQKRLGSRELRNKLTTVLAREIDQLGQEAVKNVVDARRVRKAVEELGSGLLNPKVLADLIIHVGRRSETRMRKQRKSVLEALGPDLVSGVNAVLDADVSLSDNVEDLIAQTLRQEFVHNLFVEIIHTSIVSFNKRVNPLFGGLTSSMLEGQIKSFIRMFMPMIQDQAVAFATSKSNQRVFLEFSRSIVRLLLDVPLTSFASMVSAQQRKQVEKLIKQALGDEKLEAMGRQFALSVWNDVYPKISKRKVGEIINLEKHGAALAERIADLVLVGLTRPSIVELVTEEAARIRDFQNSDSKFQTKSKRQTRNHKSGALKGR